MNIVLSLNEQGAKGLVKELELHKSHLNEITDCFDAESNEKIVSRIRVLELIVNELRRQLG